MHYPSMPLLEAYLSEKEKDTNTVVLHINHCMDNSFYFSSGLKRVYCDVIFVAVPYSRKKIPVDFDCPSYWAEPTDGGYKMFHQGECVENYTGGFIGATKQLISRALENEILSYAMSGKKIIIIEDGGYHYDVIGEYFEKYPILKEAIIGAVEQTTSGTKKSYLRQEDFYPVLSVSRSLYKIRFEAYFVANRVVDGLVRLMHEINDFVDFKSIVLLGYGIIGRSVAQSLGRYNTVISVYDNDERICKTAAADGYNLWKGSFKENMIIVGNSGKKSFTADMLHEFLNSDAKRLILASSSSKQTEFEDVIPVLSGWEHSRIAHSAIYHSANDKEVVLLADGYPLNFVDEACDSLTFDMIDPVFCEIYLLSNFLKDEGEKLQNRTYLLGMEQFLNKAICEEKLIKKWFLINGLSIDTIDFNVHPDEKKLIRLEGKQ